jgi:hypothetical protein
MDPQYLGHLSIPNDDLRALCELWLAKKGTRLMPGRSDFDPGDIPGRLWPMVMMLDVCRDDDRIRFRYRRVGMRFVDAFGRDPTGLFMDDVLPAPSEHGEYVIGLYLQAVTTRRPIYSENIFTVIEGAYPKLTRRLILPLSRDGETVDMALVGHAFEYDLSRLRAMRRDAPALVREVVAGDGGESAEIHPRHRPD